MTVPVMPTPLATAKLDHRNATQMSAASKNIVAPNIVARPRMTSSQGTGRSEAEARAEGVQADALQSEAQTQHQHAQGKQQPSRDVRIGTRGAWCASTET